MRKPPYAARGWRKSALFLAFLASSVATFAAEPKPIRGLLHNEDCTQIFYTQDFPPGKAGQVIDKYVDVMAAAGVKVFLCNTNGRRTNYQSRVWDSFWDGYDPAGPDDQPFLRPVAADNMRTFRKIVGNMLAVHQDGIDYPARVIDRCRHDGMSPWISLRMNDCHYNETANHPFHGLFWQKNPQFARQNCSGYFATCLDYARPQVRDLYKALIVETLERYDIDGLELDFMREPYLFSAGKEAEGGPILTAWIREVRNLVDAAAAKRGHAIRLGVRVPSRPETAVAMGLDAVGWSREGLIDLLVATPRWASVEFDMPLGQWRKLLGKNTTLVGGLEILYRPYPNATPCEGVAEISTGAAISVLASGADSVYLFNHFQGTWPQPVFQKTLGAMNSLDALLKQPRCVGVTFRDITGPNEAYTPPLPATGKELAFCIKLGPIPDRQRACTLRVGLRPSPAAVPVATVNGKPCKFRSQAAENGLRLLSFGVPADALPDTGILNVKVATADGKKLTVERIEAALDGKR
jgi:hypothetical protein